MVNRVDCSTPHERKALSVSTHEHHSKKGWCERLSGTGRSLCAVPLDIRYAANHVPIEFDSQRHFKQNDGETKNASSRTSFGSLSRRRYLTSARLVRDSDGPRLRDAPLNHALLDRRTSERGLLLVTDFVKCLINDRGSGGRDWSMRIWALPFLELRFREFIS